MGLWVRTKASRCGRVKCGHWLLQSFWKQPPSRDSGSYSAPSSLAARHFPTWAGGLPDSPGLQDDTATGVDRRLQNSHYSLLSGIHTSA